MSDRFGLFIWTIDFMQKYKISRQVELFLSEVHYALQKCSSNFRRWPTPNQKCCFPSEVVESLDEFMKYKELQIIWEYRTISISASMSTKCCCIFPPIYGILSHLTNSQFTFLEYCLYPSLFHSSGSWDSVFHSGDSTHFFPFKHHYEYKWID